uniref:Putative secreted peptide n=1 Tax=Anopheles braziliensis TaxID=58242 RepID=A0A2M3ZEH9_9DIPT
MATERSSPSSQLRFVALLVVLLAGNAHQVHGNSSMENRANYPSQHCTDLNSQNSLDVEQIMGIWYGSEVITHNGHDEGEVVYNTCVVIHLADVTNSTPLVPPNHQPGGSSPPYFSRGSATSASSNPDYRTSYGYGSPGSSGQGRNTGGRSDSGTIGSSNYDLYQQRQYQLQAQSMRYLRLIWDESEHTLEYTLRYNSSRPGFWISSSPQSGSMIQLQYVQFTGTVQVLKAINNQLVLTFCQSIPSGQLFTIVLSRIPMGLAPEEIQSIRNMLRRRGLPATSVRKVCQSGAFRSDPVSVGVLLLLLSALSFLPKHFH